MSYIYHYMSCFFYYKFITEYDTYILDTDKIKTIILIIKRNGVKEMETKSDYATRNYEYGTDKQDTEIAYLAMSANTGEIYERYDNLEDAFKVIDPVSDCIIVKVWYYVDYWATFAPIGFSNGDVINLDWYGNDDFHGHQLIGYPATAAG